MFLLASIQYGSAQNIVYKEPYNLYGFELKKGDTLIIGTPSGSNGRFLYVIDEGLISNKRPSKKIEGEKVVIASVYKDSETGRLKVIVKNSSIGVLNCSVIKAIDFGEVLSANGERIKLKRHYPYHTKTAYYLNEKTSVRPGDSLLISDGSLPNGDYKFISIERGYGRQFSGKKLKIKELNPRGSSRTGIKYEVILAGPRKDYRCDLWNGLESGEIVITTYERSNPGKSIADELIKLKRLKDEGVLTEEEFIEQKQKLLSRD